MIIEDLLQRKLAIKDYCIHLDPYSYHYTVDVFEELKLLGGIDPFDARQLYFKQTQNFICDESVFWMLGQRPKVINGTFTMLWSDDIHLMKLLKYLFSNNVKHVNLHSDDMNDIVNKWMPSKDILSCVDELLDAGYSKLLTKENVV